MQVENFECQIAQAQIGNFLSGSGLSDDAMQQLEEHIAGCPDCKAALAAKRNELKAMLTQERVVVDANEIFKETEQQKSAKTIAAALRKKTLQQLTQPEATVAAVAAVAAQPVAKPEPTPETPAATPKPSSYWKPLAYSLGLGAVLVGMSLFSNNLSSLFGPRANDPKATVAANTPPTTTTTAATTTATTTPSTTTSNAPVTTNPAPTSTNPASTTGAQTTPTDTSTGDVSTTGSLGATAGALATTQFSANEGDTPTTPKTTEPAKPTTAQKPVTKPQTPAKTKPAAVTTPKPVVEKPKVAKAPVKKQVRKRVVRRAKSHRAPRKHGITVYQP